MSFRRVETEIPQGARYSYYDSQQRTPPASLLKQFQFNQGGVVNKDHSSALNEFEDIYASEQLEALPLEKLNSLNGDLFKPSNINTSHVVSRPEQFYVDPPHSQPKERKLEEISPILKSNGVTKLSRTFDGSVLTRLADNMSELAFELRTYGTNIESQLQVIAFIHKQEYKFLKLRLEEREQANNELLGTIQELSEQIEVMQAQKQNEMDQIRQQHTKELHLVERKYQAREESFEDEKKKLHQHIITLEAKLREVELERSSITYSKRNMWNKESVSKPPSMEIKKEQPIEKKQSEIIEKKSQEFTPRVVRQSSPLSQDISSHDGLICPNCRKQKAPQEIHTLSNCGHSICIECFAKYLQIWLKMPSPVQVTLVLRCKCPLGRRKIMNCQCTSIISPQDLRVAIPEKCKQCPRCGAWCRQDKPWSSSNEMSCQCGLSFCFECRQDWECSNHK